MKIKYDMLASQVKKYPEIFLMDEDIYKEYMFHRIARRKDGYLEIAVKGTPVLFHRLIMGFPNSCIDHRNAVRWDCRRSNLRVATYGQNNHSVDLTVRNTSGIKGVTWDPRKCKWAARICVNRVRIWIGYFDSAELAQAAYKVSAEKLYGEFAKV